MRRKKKYLTFLAILFPLLISIGFASWVIIYTIEFETEYKKQPTADLFGLSQEVVYNDTYQVPTPLNGVTLESLGITSDEIEYSYKLTTEKNFTENAKPIDAGEYDVRIKISGSTNMLYDGVCQVKFTIKKKKIQLKTNIIGIDYGTLDSSDQWTSMRNKIKENIVFLENGDPDTVDTVLSTNSYKFTGIHNGVYYYGDEGYSVSGLTPTTNIAGSTYVGEIELNYPYSINYEFMDINGVKGNKVIVKYKTAKIGDKYYTIEDAINAGASVVSLAGNSSSATSYVETCFTKISTTDGNPYGKYTFEISSGSTLLVPYTNSTSLMEVTTTNSSTAYVYSALTIPNGITLDVYGNIYAGGKICYAQPNTSITLHRGVIVNNGIINCYSGSSLNSYGYTKGTGIINLETGSAATDVMRVYDFPGGTAATQLLSSAAYPMNSWTLNNISCKTYIKNGARYYGHVYLKVTGMESNKAYIVVGTTADNNCIFKSSGDSGNYILKYTINADSTPNDTNLIDISGSNQLCGQRSIMEISGDYTDAPFIITVTIGEGLFSYEASIETSTSKSLPIGYMDIVVKNGSYLMLSKSDYLFLPGTTVTVENGAKVDIGSGVDISFATVEAVSSGSQNATTVYNFLTKCVDKVDAELIVNGQMIISGSIGGTVKSTGKGATINLTNTSAGVKSSFSSLYSTADPYYYTISDFQAFGRINSTDDSSFIVGNYYISEYVNSQYTWSIATNVKNFTINFYDGSSLLNSISIGVANTTTYTFTGSEYKPEKMYYEFSHWTNSSGVNVEGTLFSTEEINVYASWTEIEYKFDYTYFIENADGTLTQIDTTNTNLTTNEPLNYKFTLSSFINNQITIPVSPTYTNKYFYGWYLYDGNELNETYNIKMTLTKEVFESIVELLDQNGLTTEVIPLCCKFTDYQTYTVIINSNIEGIDSVQLEGVIPTNDLDLNDYSSYSADDSSKPVYFICWSITTNDTTSKYSLSLDSKVQNALDQIDNYNAENNNSLVIENNTIYIYGVVQQKCKVSYKEVNYLGNYIEGTQKIENLYYLPGTLFDYSSYYNKSLTSFPKSTYYSEEYNDGGTIDLSTHTVLISTADYEKGVQIIYKYYLIIEFKIIKGSGRGVSAFEVIVDKIYDETTTKPVEGDTYDSATTIKTIEGAQITRLYVKSSGFFTTATITLVIGSATVLDHDVGGGFSSATYTHPYTITLTSSGSVTFG